MGSLAEIRARLEAEVAEKKARKLRLEAEREVKGKLGEALSLRWLRSLRFEVEEIPQDRETKDAFVTRNGKRPDYSFDVDGTTVYADAKLHTIRDGIFALGKEELTKYEVFLAEKKREDLVFLVVPNETRNEIFLVHIVQMTIPRVLDGPALGAELDHNYRFPLNFSDEVVAELAAQGIARDLLDPPPHA